MNWFANRDLSRRVEALEAEVRELRTECSFLRSASTMRVGEMQFYPGWYTPDTRPVLTAMDAVKKLMENAGIAPVFVHGTQSRVDLVQAKEEA